ncbi:hypothetical protein [Ferrimonas balearica]|uniref:hypothetical protein n=1 Tax=Ferrimonas balearica TaxID=44012 RepID=UPI001C9981AC|nr:hypothetical protein [Ferrimonas balearica]MBY5922011.1 hypothetical protein [Ferrimonas balearica]MBY5994649.1 hypothetical protein [Ferrimonas balearica]
MSSNLEKGLIEVGYFLSRMGTDSPPASLKAASWKEAYSKFYNTFGIGKTEEEFKNSLKNLRDHFDSHLENNRIGWKDDDGNPQQLSSSNQHVFDELQKLNDSDLWVKIKPYVVTSLNTKLSKIKSKEVTAKKAKFFSSEFNGKKKLTARKVVEATVNHGLVVDELKEYVESTVKNSFTYNTQKIDLALETAGELQRIYEVKTATDTQSIYTAVGQLCMHSAGSEGIEKWMVLPGPIENTELLECLDTLDISVLWYQIDEGSCNFELNK